MNRTPVRSSNIANVGYENSTLEIAFFHDYGSAEGVKRVVHDDVMPLAESHDQLPNMWWCTLAKTP